MGKGDKKTKRGKITRGTFGVRRRRKRNKPIAVVIAPEPKAKAEPKTKAKPKAKAESKAKAEPKAKAKTKAKD